jgi:hypothetical protein
LRFALGARARPTAFAVLSVVTDVLSGDGSRVAATFANLLSPARSIPSLDRRGRSD